METTSTATQAPTYWFTSQGSHRHADYLCAARRKAQASAVHNAAADNDLPLCEHCCGAAAVAADTATRTATPAPEYCPNPGVEMTHRISSECKACGKTGKVVRGKLRAHKPA